MLASRLTVRTMSSVSKLSLGGSRYKDLDRAFFSNRYGNNPGAASKADDWQILSPIRSGLEGVDALNRSIQVQFRRRWHEMAIAEGWRRKIPKPFGSQQILYGDKVINVVNQKRRDVWPATDGDAYLANGDLGIVVGQYKGPKSTLRGLAVETGGGVRWAARTQVRILERRIWRRSQESA